MKKFLFLLLLATPCIAGKITFNQNLGGTLGTVVLSTYTGTSSPPSGFGFLNVAHGPIVVTSSSTTYITAGSTLLNNDTNQINTEVTFHTAGTISGLWAMSNSNSLTNTSTNTLQVNGANGNEVVKFNGGVTGEQQDTTDTDSVSAGNTVNFKLVTSSAGNSIGLTGIAFVFTPTTNNMLKMVDTENIQVTGSGNGFATYFENISGSMGNASGQWANQTESLATYNPKVSGTFSHMGIYVVANGRPGTTTINFRKNGANGNQSITIGSGQTGLFEDNTHSDSVVSGDTVCYSIVMDGNGSSNNILTSYIDSEFTTVGNGMEYPAPAQSGHTFAQGTTFFTPIQGATGVDSSEISDYQVKSQVPGTLSNMHVFVNSSTLNQAVTITMRKNQADCGPSITIPANATGPFADNTHTCSVVANDELDYKYSVPSGSGSAPYSYIGSLFTHN